MKYNKNNKLKTLIYYISRPFSLSLSSTEISLYLKIYVYYKITELLEETQDRTLQIWGELIGVWSSSTVFLFLSFFFGVRLFGFCFEMFFWVFGWRENGREQKNKNEN